MGKLCYIFLFLILSWGVLWRWILYGELSFFLFAVGVMGVVLVGGGFGG